MNLVIDDAVEVAQVTKSNDQETRRPLGTYCSSGSTQAVIGHGSRAYFVQQARSSSREIMFH